MVETREAVSVTQDTLLDGDETIGGGETFDGDKLLDNDEMLVADEMLANDEILDDGEMLDAGVSFDKMVFFAFDEARQKLEQGGEVEPFAVTLSGDDLYVESHPGESIIDCFNSARIAIDTMRSLISAYVFCYDGYVNLDEGTHDALIAERAQKDDEVGEAFALFYHVDEEGGGLIEFDEEVFSLGEAPSLFITDEFDETSLEGFDEG